MFKKYDNITITDKCCDAKRYKSFNSPYEDYNESGELMGYHWQRGTQVDLEFNLSGEINYPSDAIVYTAVGQAPDESTQANINDFAYNVADLKMWQLKSIVDSKYIWVAQSIYEAPNLGDKQFYIDISQYIANKKLSVSLYDVNFNVLDKQIFDSTTELTYTITKELADILIAGIYYISLDCFDPTTLYTLSIISIGDLRITIT